jgi:transcriptional regulator with XRE-family HTH domain
VPKGGTIGQRQATDEEFKAWLRLRLDELGWSNVELARRLGVTPGAITHLFKKAVTSTLRPKIEMLLGRADADAPVAGLAAGTRPSSSTSREAHTEQLAELISYFQSLNSENRVRLIERARSLWDTQAGPRKI